MRMRPNKANISVHRCHWQSHIVMCMGTIYVMTLALASILLKASFSNGVCQNLSEFTQLLVNVISQYVYTCVESIDFLADLQWTARFLSYLCRSLRVTFDKDVGSSVASFRPLGSTCKSNERNLQKRHLKHVS